MKIKPVSTWQNGQEVFATDFVLQLTYDNLVDSASFQYVLSTNENAVDGQNRLVVGQLYMNNPDYDLWNDSPNINQDAYTWALSKLNLEKDN